MCRSPMKRLTASQKSSRTRTTAWTRSPSHCRSGLGEFGVLPSRGGVKPLLELVEDDEYLLALAQALPLAQGRNRPGQVQVARHAGTAFPQPLEQPGLGVGAGGLDVNREDLVRQAGQQPGLHQRRFAAARRPVDHPHREGEFVGGLDTMFPEADAFGQAVLVPWAGEQVEEEVRILGVEGPQALGNDGNGGEQMAKQTEPGRRRSAAAVRVSGPAPPAARPRSTIREWASAG